MNSKHETQDIEALLQFRHDKKQRRSDGTGMQSRGVSDLADSPPRQDISPLQSSFNDSSSLQKLMQTRSDKLSKEAANYLKTSASQVHRLSPGTSSNEESDVHDISSSSVSDGVSKISSNGQGHTGKKRKYKPKSNSSASAKSKTDGSEKPKRPLSAYNFFFRDERARIIAGDSTGGEGQDAPDAPKSNRIYPKGKTPHRKITFEKLGKLIAERWKSLDDNERSVFNKMAEDDSFRYRSEMQEFYERENAKRRAKYFPGMTEPEIDQMDSPNKEAVKPQANHTVAPTPVTSTSNAAQNVILSPAHAFASLVQQTMQQAPGLMQQGTMNMNGTQAQATLKQMSAPSTGNRNTNSSNTNCSNAWAPMCGGDNNNNNFSTQSMASFPSNASVPNMSAPQQVQTQQNLMGNFMPPQNQQQQMPAQNNLLSLLLQQNLGQQQQFLTSNNLLNQLLSQQQQMQQQQQQQQQFAFPQQNGQQQQQMQQQQHQQQQQFAFPQQNGQQSNMASLLMQLAASFGNGGQGNKQM